MKPPITKCNFGSFLALSAATLREFFSIYAVYAPVLSGSAAKPQNAVQRSDSGVVVSQFFLRFARNRPKKHRKGHFVFGGMKYFSPSLLALSFIGIAIFGFVLFNMVPAHAGGCIASAVGGTACPINIADFATHHISALQALTRTIVPPIFSWLALLAFLLSISVSMVLCYKNVSHQKSEFLRKRLRDLKSNSFYGQQKIISWLALFENSPAF